MARRYKNEWARELPQKYRAFPKKRVPRPDLGRPGPSLDYWNKIFNSFSNLHGCGTVFIIVCRITVNGVTSVVCFSANVSFYLPHLVRHQKAAAVVFCCVLLIFTTGNLGLLKKKGADCRATFILHV